MNDINRRMFLSSAAAISLGGAGARAFGQDRGEAMQGRAPAPRLDPPQAPVAISSENGQRAVDKAVELIRGGADPVDAVVAGVSIVEDDPEDMSVGLGGLPNERGVVELDASVMHGPSHKAGAVAALQNVRNASQVALQVLRRTDHVLLVGQGALEFARAMGFPEQNLLTEKSRQAWLKWKANLTPADDWLDEKQQRDYEGKTGRDAEPPPEGAGSGGSPPKHSALRTKQPPLTWGTIHCAAVDTSGDISACTTTSGLSFKLPGRVGDSPIVGAGMFVDNAVGAAGATGRGESVIQSCGAFQVVRHMADGVEPTDACLLVLKWIADHTRGWTLLDDHGRPNFDVTLYALRKDGAYGSATMRQGERFTAHDGAASRLIDCPYLFERPASP
jgi:N4-(beta-N-acetylglucosaminyl)-L-asparaginase